MQPTFIVVVVIVVVAVESKEKHSLVSEIQVIRCYWNPEEDRCPYVGARYALKCTVSIAHCTEPAPTAWNTAPLAEAASKSR